MSPDCYVSAISTALTPPVAAPVKGDKSLSIYPNPAYGTTFVQVYSDNYQDARLQVSSLNGGAVISRNVNLEQGPNTLLVDIHHLPAGMYVVQLTTAQGIAYANSKLTVLR